MKRFGAVLLSVALLLACAVPAGAYHWSGKSFLDDYYGVSPLDAEFDVGHFELRSLDGAQVTVSGDYSGAYTFGKPSQTTVASATRLFYGMERVFVMRNTSVAPFGSFVWEFSYTSCVLDFVFDTPVDSFQLDGILYAYVNGAASYWNASESPINSGVSFYSNVEIVANGEVIKSFSEVSNSALDVSSVSYQSDTPIESFSIRFAFDRSVSFSCTNVYFRGYSVSVTLETRTSSPFAITVVPHDPDNPAPGPVDPDPPGPVDPDPPDPIVPGEGDFKYTAVTGEELAKGVQLASGTSTGGASVFWEFDSYTIGSPPYQVTVSGGSAHTMAPSKFPSITLSRSAEKVQLSIPSTSHSQSWQGSQRITQLTSLLTGPPGFSGPGTAANDYIDLVIPFTSEEEVYNFELDGAVLVETSYRAGSSSASRVGGSWSLMADGALAASGTTDTYGNIQFNHFTYHSSEPLSSLTLRLVPATAGLAFPTNSGSVTFSWSMSLDFKGLSMVYLEGEDEEIDFTDFYNQINGAQGSIDSYDKIESQWVNNMTSNWNSLKLDTFAFDAGLISGFALLSGIFNDVWNAFGVFNVIWAAPLMLGIALLVVGRISRTSGAGKEGK